MKLVITIVQSADSGKLTDALVAKGFRSTRISTVGGFLDEPNVTMFIGTEDEELNNLLTIIRQNCQARRRYMNAAPMSIETAGMPVVTAAIEVEVGGAAVFVMPVRHIARIGKTDVLPPSGLSGPQGVLILAVVQSDVVAPLAAILIKAGYRFTRINSVGNFLKKGNATLLMGVTADHLDKALSLMQTCCRQRMEPNPVKSGLPSYAVTAFITDILPLKTLL